MIDKQAFATGMGLLAGAFGRAVDAPVSRAYYGILNPRMDTAEFETAVNRVLAEETFWPSPAKLLGYVRNNPLDAGTAALEHVNRVLSEHGGHLYLPHDKYLEAFDMPTRGAIAAVGGLAAIVDTPIDRHPSLVKRFSDAYVRAQQPGLPQQQTDPRVKQLVGSVAEKIGGHDRRLGRDA